MKYVVFVPDGCADVPLEALDGRTPLEAARMPRLAALAARGEVGRAAVIPDGLPPGSDVGNMAILGFDPARYHTGRAPIEAAAMGVELGPDEVAYRCNLVTVSDDSPPVMVDFAAGHPTNEQSHAIIAAPWKLPACCPAVAQRALPRTCRTRPTWCSLRLLMTSSSRSPRHLPGGPDRPWCTAAARSIAGFCPPRPARVP